MQRLDVQIPAPDGHSRGTLHVPGGRVVPRRQAGRRRRPIEFYPARHGFAVPDLPAYDPDADARHWEAVRDLYRAHL